jgi:hypothetical protein
MGLDFVFESVKQAHNTTLHPSVKGISMAKVLFHLFMTLITGGLWLIGLIIYAIVKK